MKFTEDEINKIEKLNVKCVHSKGGFNGDLHWGFDNDKLYIDLFYESMDVDGDWGTSIKRHYDITFDELLETIKNPYSKFDTRSWN